MTKLEVPGFNKLPLYLDYILLQPALRNRVEYKLVFINGEFIHEFNCTSNIGNSFSFSGHARLIQFGKEAIAQLKKRCPTAEVHGLVRVDVMETQELEEFAPSTDERFMKSFKWFVASNGKYYRRRIVVNEFEGIQANYKDSPEVDALLCDYFVNVFNKEIEKVLQRM